MEINVPDRVLEILADIEPREEHDPNGPGFILCHACGGEVSMRWMDGRQLTTTDEVVHDADCPALWAKRLLRSNT